MPSLKTNFIRTQITSQCYRYQFQLISNQPVDPKYHPELQSYFLSLNPFIVFGPPYVYSIDEMSDLKSFNFMLSNGQKTHVNILVSNTIMLNSKEVAGDVHRQLMKGTNFLYSEGLNICLNPFDERKVNHCTSLMPGFSLVTETNQNCIGFYLIPLQAKITEFHSLSALHEHSIVLDYNSGTFYQKSSIVRYDKQNEVVYFRTGEQLKKEDLKSLEILPLNGFELAVRLTGYYKRLREGESGKKFIEKWQMKFDSRFMELPYNFFPVGHITFNNRQQKSLGQCIGSINAYNFQHGFRKLFSTSTLDQNMRATLYFLLPQIHKPQQTIEQQTIDLQDPYMDYYCQLVAQEEQFAMGVIEEMQKIKQRMKLNDVRILVLRYDVFAGWVNGMAKTIRQIEDIVKKENQQNPGDKVFLLTNYEQIVREQRQLQLGAKFMPDTDNTKPLYKSITNYFVQNSVFYHSINAKDNDFRKYLDIIALKTISTLQHKLRLNPWKIKDIPFGTKPLITFSLHVKHETNNTVTVSAVGSLNAFLSKYTCQVANCEKEKYLDAVVSLLTEEMNKFCSIHKIYPKRAMIFRTGDFTNSCQNEFSLVEQKLTESFACKPTYILLSCETPLRVYNQIDFNYISKDTVKPTQMLCQIRYNNERFIQLEMDNPMYRMEILGLDTQEINFEEKVMELATKLCFTYQLLTEMKFGKGLGFLGYGEKLYNWAKEFPNIKEMQNSLREGVLIFL